MEPLASGIVRYPFRVHVDLGAVDDVMATPTVIRGTSTTSVRMLALLVRQILEPESDSDTEGATVILTCI